MPSVVTLLFAAFMLPDAQAGDDLQPPAFCADMQPFTAFTIADDDEFAEDEFAEDMGCSESDGNGPLDVEAQLDAV